jgi:murein L,D-transpeptidase YafK
MVRLLRQGCNRLTGSLLATVLCCAIAPPLHGADFPLADEVVIKKSERLLLLKYKDEVLKTAKIALGLAPKGHKREEGDFRTPEGRYLLDDRNADSDFFLSIRVSYPNAADEHNATRRGVAPGGQIMIHGQPNEPKYNAEFYRRTDWTNGCIAVSNSDMVDIWLMTTVNTPITILP